MKTLLLALTLGVFIALSVAGSHGGRNKGGKSGGHRGGRKGNFGKPCKLQYQNGTSGDTAPCFPAAFFVCEDVDLTKFANRKPGYLVDVAALGKCRPKTCTSDADCSDGGVCTTDRVKPDKATMDALMTSCFPDRPIKPESASNSAESASNSAEDGSAQLTKRCSLPAGVRVARKACQVNYAGQTINKPCMGRRGTTVACNVTVACSVTFGGQSATLQFCERPQTVATGQGPSGAQPLTQGNGQGQATGGRGRGHGNRQGGQGGQNQRRGNRGN